jgi:hypothetical protein
LTGGEHRLRHPAWKGFRNTPAGDHPDPARRVVSDSRPRYCSRRVRPMTDPGRYA